MTEVFNENYENTTMTESQKQAVLRLLYKKEERELLKNWRPISLLNVDYKIVATVMANRLRKVLPEIIHEDQTCGVPNRSIYENLFRLRDMTYNTRKNNTNMILVGLDQEKAFDRVDRTFLLRILQKMNFGRSSEMDFNAVHRGGMPNYQQRMVVRPNTHRTRTSTRVPIIATTVHLSSRNIRTSNKKGGTNKRDTLSRRNRNN